MGTVEGYSRRRNALLVSNAMSLLAWQSTELTMFRESFAQGWAAYLAPLFIVVWGVSLLLLAMKPAERLLRQQLEDELTRHNRRRALVTGYCWVMFCASLALVLTSYHQVNSTDIARAIFVIGAAVPMLTFAVMERVDGAEQ